MGKRVLVALVRGLTQADRGAVERWWRALAPRERASLRLEPRRRVFGRWVEADEPVPEPTVDLYEYLVAHELLLEDGPPMHICTAHPALRRLVRRGRIPASFACPLGRARCPMRALLDEGRGRDLALEAR